MKRLLCCVLFFTFLTVVEAKPRPRVEPIEPKEFLRIKKTGDKVSALEIAITRYETDKIKVDLVGVVHIGDRTYYQELNKRLATYETVLYELVAPEGTKPDKGKKHDLMKIMGFLLDIDSQMAVVDYNKKNFVHADMSFDEMMKVAGERGDDKITIGLSVLVDILRKNNLAANDKKIENINFSLENPNAMKQQMASQMVSSTDLGATMKKLLVDDRNKKVCQVLSKEIAAGKTHFAIFYGAAHNSDFDKRLRGEFGMKCMSQEWLPAWGNLDSPPVQPAARLLKIFLDN